MYVPDGLSWPIIRARDVALTLGYAPIDTMFVAKLLSQLGKAQCNGQQAFGTTYLVGVGPPLSLYRSLSVGYSSGTTKVKYYQDDGEGGKSQLVGYNEDFGVSDDGLSAEWRAQMADVSFMPMAAYAVVPGIPAVAVVGMRGMVCRWMTDPCRVSGGHKAVMCPN
jgi:hypothetical protein